MRFFFGRTWICLPRSIIDTKNHFRLQCPVSLLLFNSDILRNIKNSSVLHFRVEIFKFYKKNLLLKTSVDCFLPSTTSYKKFLSCKLRLNFSPCNIILKIWKLAENSGIMYIISQPARHCCDECLWELVWKYIIKIKFLTLEKKEKHCANL